MHAWSTMVRWEVEESPSLPGRCLFLTPCQSSEGLAEGKDPGDPGRTILSTEKAPGSGEKARTPRVGGTSLGGRGWLPPG